MMFMELYLQMKLNYCSFIKKNTDEVNNKYSIANVFDKVSVLIIHVSFALCLIVFATMVYEPFAYDI